MRQLTAICLLLQGCVMGIPDANPPVKPPKPCEVWVVQRPENTVVCVTREEFNRAMKGVLY